MSHTLYKTEGIVLGSINTGESNQYISIFTRDFGLISALAKSVREEKSKLRYSLQNLSYLDTSLVRGRDIWRITGAIEQYNLYKELSCEREKLEMLVRIITLLKRLVHGEEKNEKLFLTISSGIDYVRSNPLNVELLINAEYTIVLRMLSILGYIAKTEDFNPILSSSNITQGLLQEMMPVRDSALRAINKALEESQL